MSTYYWNVNDLLNERNKLVEMYNNEEDIFKKSYYLKFIGILDNFNLVYNTNAKCTTTINNKIFEAANEKTAYKGVDYVIKDFYYSLLPLRDKFNEIQDMLYIILGDDYDFTEKLNLKMSDDESITKMIEFYKQLDPTLFKYLKPNLEDIEHHLNFIDGTIEDENKISTDGNCLYIGGVDKNYISVVRDNDSITKYFNLIHEFGHAIGNSMNPLYSFQERLTVLGEVPSIFPEMLSLTLNKINIPEVQRLHMIFSTLLTYFHTASYLCTQDVIIDTWEDNKYKVDSCFYKKLKDEYGISRSVLKTALDYSISSSSDYIIGYSITCELLYIYKQDPKKALKIFKQILKMNYYEDDLAFVSNLINLNEHLREVNEEFVDNYSLVLKGML